MEPKTADFLAVILNEISSPLSAKNHVERIEHGMRKFKTEIKDLLKREIGSLEARMGWVKNGMVEFKTGVKYLLKKDEARMVEFKTEIKGLLTRQDTSMKWFVGGMTIGTTIGFTGAIVALITCPNPILTLQ